MTTPTRTELNTLPSAAQDLPTAAPLDGLGSRIDDALHQGGQAARRLSQQAGDFARHSGERLHQQGAVWREQVVHQVHEHPLRSVALAAAGGVLLALVARKLLRR